MAQSCKPFGAFFNSFQAGNAAIEYRERVAAQKSFNEFFQTFSELLNRKTEYIGERELLERSKDFFEQFSTLYGALRKSGTDFNIWQIIGLGRDEVFCTKILAWFLKENEGHGQGSRFLKSLINLIPDNYWSTGKRPEVANHYTAHEEAVHRADGSRLDIEINGNDFYLIIEAKIDTCEHGGQLSRYAAIARKIAPHKPWAICYLTLTGIKSADLPDACPISWRDIARSFRAALAESSSQLSPASLLCVHFCEYIENL